jgi:hypothetical protein
MRFFNTDTWKEKNEKDVDGEIKQGSLTEGEGSVWLILY